MQHLSVLSEGRSPRILHVTPAFRPSIGGIENVVDCLSRESLRHGIRADVAHVARGLIYEAQEEENGRTIFRVPLVGHPFFGLAPLLGRIATSFDLLHVHDPQILSITTSVRLLAGQVPAVLSTHGGFHHTNHFSRLKSLHEKLFLRIMLRSYRIVLATSHNDMEYFSTYTDRIMLANNGIELNRFDVSGMPAERSIWRWLYWGRIAEHKRLDLVIALVRLARTMGFPVELTIAGPDFDGSLVGLQRLIGASDQNCIRCLPPQDDRGLAGLIARAGVYVTASEHEGFGLTILEAMAAGLAVVARNTPPMNEFVTAENGLLLNFSDDDQDTTALKDFLTGLKGRAGNLARSAKETANKYSWEQRFGDFLEGYRLALTSEKTW